MQCSHIYQQLTLGVTQPCWDCDRRGQHRSGSILDEVAHPQTCGETKLLFLFFLNRENYRLQMETQKSFLNISTKQIRLQIANKLLLLRVYRHENFAGKLYKNYIF